MTQVDSDRLVALKKAKKKLITQPGTRSWSMAGAGRLRNRRIQEQVEREAVKILSDPLNERFGPTLAAEYPSQKHGIEASKETVPGWMMRAELWEGRKPRSKQCMCGGRGGGSLGNWCSGIPASTIG